LLAEEGRSVTWLESVTDAQFQGPERADVGTRMDDFVSGDFRREGIGAPGIGDSPAHQTVWPKVASSADTGTEIVLRVPGRSIFRKQTNSLLDKCLARLG